MGASASVLSGARTSRFDADLFLGEESGKSKLLANPSLRAVDGAEGRIQIGDELRFQVLQPTSMGGQPVYTVETVDVGIILEFTPTITEDGRVRLELRAESSSVSGYTAGFPNIRKREARTELIIQNGETIVIGGLVSEDEIETLREVPLLSEIPILGQLFRHRSVERRPQELVFFITPRILYAADGTLNTDEQRLSSGKDTEPMGWVQELPEGLADRIIDTTAGAARCGRARGETATAPEPAPHRRGSRRRLLTPRIPTRSPPLGPWRGGTDGSSVDKIARRSCSGAATHGDAAPFPLSGPEGHLLSLGSSCPCGMRGR